MKFYLTTPIYYVNAKPHVGSAYTTVAADVLARWHRQQGHDTHFLAGLAEHGQKIAQSAAEAGLSPQEFTDRNSQFFLDAWQKLAISNDDFIRTTEQRHQQAVSLFFTKLKKSSQVYEADYEGLYCVGHEAFIKENELDAARNCPDHGQPPEKVKERNWFFKLSVFGDAIKQLINSGEFTIEPESRRNEVLAFIDQGLEDIAISRRTVDWAFKLPWDNEQTIYVWLDELFNYCTAVGYGADEERFKKWWPADVHIVGKDIIKFHCIIWPALLLAIGEDIPKKVFAHGFFTVSGQKISKSLGNAIDPMELSEEWGADAVRYYMLREIPFGNDGDFSHQRLKNRYNADLANGLGNMVSRTLQMIENFNLHLTSAESPPPAVKALLDSASKHTETLAFDKALASIWQAISWADALIEETKPWELAKKNTPFDNGELEGILTQLYDTLVAVNESLAPYMPETHAKLSQLLTTRPLQKPSEPLFARK